MLCYAAIAQGGANVGNDVACAVTAIFDALFFKSLFGGPSFHGSLQPRPNTGQVWNDTYGVPYTGLSNGVTSALGLPSSGCEFGVCGGGLGFTEPGQANQNENGPRYPYLPPSLPSNRNAQGRNPGPETPSPTPRPVGEPPYNPVRPAVPGQDYTKLRYVFLKALEWLHGGAGQIDPIVIVSPSPSVVVPFPGYCPPNRQTQKGCLI